MTDLARSDSSDESIEDIVAALNELRDVLVDLSLTMKDLMFEVDSVGRSEALERAKVLINRSKHA
ncbi:hypothetical protein [Rhodoferax saidenbachensis]|uniref:Uncharacterized protein n=1 Tax=Rhodoferax saidenbachensis TaxID=1484693 RepID=A0A1P8K8K1_9BURK|nr:hypothetical protein [Rhodoferax saidenbachensis]APW42315.1 hypothetical protein RS694_07025 [Rhodoferax saidenbachensis]